MQLEILKQVQNDNYQGIIHKKCHAEFISASRIIVKLYRTNCIFWVNHYVILACPESFFFQKDSRQAGMTDNFGTEFAINNTDSSHFLVPISKYPVIYVFKYAIFFFDLSEPAF